MLVPLVLLFVLLIFGLRLEELSWSQAVLYLGFAAFALAAFVLFAWPPMIYTAVLALLDVVLIIVIFKGDIKIR